MASRPRPRPRHIDGVDASAAEVPTPAVTHARLADRLVGVVGSALHGTRCTRSDRPTCAIGGVRARSFGECSAGGVACFRSDRADRRSPRHARPEDRHRRPDRDACGVPDVRPVQTRTQGVDLRIRSDQARRPAVRAGPRPRGAARRTRLDDRHRRRPGDHAGGDGGRGARAVDRRVDSACRSRAAPTTSSRATTSTSR